MTKYLKKKKGILYAKNEDAYDHRVNRLLEYLVEHEGHNSEFKKYFLENVYDRMKNGVCKPYWAHKCDHGYMNNLCETMHNTIKVMLNREKVMPHEVVKECLTISRNQWKEVRSAISQEGDYKFMDCIKKKFVYDRQTWHDLDKSKQDKHVDKLINFYCKKESKDPKYILSTDKKLKMRKPPGLARKPNSRKRKTCSKTTTHN